MENNMKKQIYLLLFCCLIVVGSTIHAEEFNVHHSLSATSTCDLPQGAKITYGIPVRDNAHYYLGLLKYQNNLDVLLIELDGSASKCANNNIDKGKILSNLSVNSQVVDGSKFINLECKKDKSKHHFIGIVAQRRFTKRFVHPEQAWEVNWRTSRFNEVKSAEVECFVGGYD